MKFNNKMEKTERIYLRELAKRQLEYASLPVMKEREKLWYMHNSLCGDRPLIVVEHVLFLDDILPELKCQSTVSREIEKNLLISILNHELIDDDKVIPAYYKVLLNVGIKEFDIEIKKEYAEDSNGKKLGYAREYPVKDLKKSLPQLRHSTFSVDREATLEWKSFVEEAIGDILPVKIKNESLDWHVTPSEKVVRLMGLENMMYSIMDYPGEMHELYNFINEDIMVFIKWQEKEGLLTLNNENDFIGSGSYGFIKELPSKDFNENQMVTMKDIWVNMNSQETVGISPQMYKEFIFPYYYQLAGEFGLAYYGCCEPVHKIWEGYIRTLPGLRKVSVSPWCDEEYMGNALRGSKVIYSRKPSPNYIGVEKNLDESAFGEHISSTLKAAKGCSLELIFRDIYNLSGNIYKPGKAVQITRNLIEQIW